MAWYIPLILAALTPIATTAGTIAANELQKWAEAGYPLPEIKLG